MNITARRLAKVARKLGLRVKNGKKHVLVYGESGLVDLLFPAQP